jgi:hypothetical protein
MLEKEGKSLSGVVENYLKSVTSTNQQYKFLLNKQKKMMQSIVKLPKDFDYKKNYRRHCLINIKL